MYKKYSIVGAIIMLRKIIIKNVNSIDVCELDLLKGDYRYLSENVNGNLVNPAVIYGHNGSGKSSIMNAISHFIGMMSLPAEAVAPFIVNNFLFDKYIKGGKKEKNLIKGSVELFFDIDGKTNDYFIETSRDNFVSKEYLMIDGNTYFEIKNGKYYFNGSNYDIENKTTSRIIPFLRILASSEIVDSTIQTIFNYIKSFTHVNAAFINRGTCVTSSIFNNTSVFDLLVNRSPDVKNILKNYKNFPVYTIVKDNIMMPNGFVSQQYNVVLEDKDFKGKIPYQMISNGMQNQSLILSILLSMPKYSVLFIDEADIALHPCSLKSFFDVIKKSDIQVIMTLHNTNAMQYLRPDQVFFAYWSKGFSTVHKLSKIYPNIREINNIEKMYLSFVFDDEIEWYAK